MTASRLLLALGLALTLAACDMATVPDATSLGGVYVNAHVDEIPEGAGLPDFGPYVATITLDIPPTTSGTFELGPFSTYSVSNGSSSDSVTLTGSGTLTDGAVSLRIIAPPNVSVGFNGVRLERDDNSYGDLTGPVGEGGATVTLGFGSTPRVFSRP